MSDFYSERTIKARKRHRCICSGAWIEIGEYYVYGAGCQSEFFFCGAIHEKVKPIYDRRYRETYSGEPIGWEQFLEDLEERADTPKGQEDLRIVTTLNGTPESLKTLIQNQNT